MPKQKKTKKETSDVVVRVTGTSLGQVVEKLSPKLTKAQKDEQVKQARREAAEKYEDIKQKVLDREEENYSEIIVLRDKEIPGSKKKRWWKTTGHSTIILKYRIGKIHHLSFAIQEDTDFGPRSKEGVISIPNLDEFLEKLARRGYTDVKKGKEVVVIKLGERLRTEEYQELVTEEERLIEHSGKMVRPAMICPALDKTLKEMDKQVHEMVRKMDRQSQDAYANEMEKITTGLSIKLTRVARGSYDFEEFLTELFEAKENLWGYLGVVMDRRAFALEKIAKVGEAIREMERQAEIEKRIFEKDKNEGSAREVKKK
ncbi:hypothetical protein IKG73_02130 [Candidatus Saccharibacteria bacterium]|nr:hypothetical protein [Candidatus Saccharibacteria bacterium]